MKSSSLSCRAWLTQAQAIAAATINTAAANQADSSTGSIEQGKKAHLLKLYVDDCRQPGYRFRGNLVRTIIKGKHIINNGECI